MSAEIEKHQKKMHFNSIEKIANLPVVESVHAYYGKIKNSSQLIRWSLLSAETAAWLTAGVGAYLVCRSLDVIEAVVSTLTYPLLVVYSKAKGHAAQKLKRADSGKQLSASGANICGEHTPDRLENSIADAKKYVGTIADAVLLNEPDSGEPESSSKAAKVVQKVKQFGFGLKLPGRLAEAKGIVEQRGAATVRTLAKPVQLTGRLLESSTKAVSSGLHEGSKSVRDSFHKIGETALSPLHVTDYFSDVFFLQRVLRSIIPMVLALPMNTEAFINTSLLELNVRLFGGLRLSAKPGSHKDE